MMDDFPPPECVTALITQKKVNIVILGIPPRKDYQEIVDYMKAMHISHWYICCDIDPSIEFFRKNGIEVIETKWEDGSSPPQHVVQMFLSYFNSTQRKKDEYIAVSCQFGYGRAPTLGAIALIERGLKPAETLKYLRSINEKFITERQKNFILQYHPQMKANKKCRI